ncbi:MAG: hypothetical protein IH870_09505, partial [Chloroflexi bacterium]|nr:hypothetical protein [Chloroflexota bacterium]
MLRLDLQVHTRHSPDSPDPTAPIPLVVRHYQNMARSDAPSALELGSTYTEVPDFVGTPAGLIRAAASGQIAGRTPNPRWLMAPGFARPRKA